MLRLSGLKQIQFDSISQFEKVKNLDTAQVGDSSPNDINKNLLVAFSWQIGWPAQSILVQKHLQLCMSGWSLCSK